ncbi:putative tubulin--tyrosine ligase pby1, variant 2 [Naganishia albida]|nr:putative tubulin--tyrosine ligase pby1, variant 2 [Naganishia albida]
MSEIDKKLSVFVNFPSPYTHSLILAALTSVLPALSLTFEPPTEDDVPDLQWADYDLLCLDTIQANPDTQLISSYVYRKTLIRKHMLHTAIQEYLAKQRHRGNEENVLEKGIPRGWALDIQFADELDELMMDDLYDLREDLQENENIEDLSERKWFVLKPGMSDKGQGIRMFSTEAELTAIFESFEPESDDEEEDDEDEAEDDDGQKLTTDGDAEELRKMKELALKDFPEDESFEHQEQSDEEEDGGTGVQTSQLRHFVIQEYVPRPLLIDPLENTRPSGVSLQGHKFHLRAYVMMTGTYQLYLAQTMLALFSDEAFALPSQELELNGTDLRAHLTNTCLQNADDSGPPEHLVKLFWELEGQTVLSSDSSKEPMRIDKQWLETVFKGTGDVIAETVKAAAECGSFGLQLMPNAFEIFGVDLLLSFDGSDSQSTPIISLLEFNASPDFTQSGNRLRKELGGAFQGVIKLVVAPFFGVKRFADENEDGHPESTGVQVGEEKFGWRKIGEQETRGTW